MEFKDFDSVDELVETIFSAPPGEPKSIQLQFANETDPQEAESNIFRALGQIMTHGIVRLYGDKIRLSSLNPKQLRTIRRYLHSIGYELHLNHPHPETIPNVIRRTLIIPDTRDGPKYYKVHFSFLR